MADKNIPESLKKLKQWVVWRYEERPGEPKPAKVPYNPNAKHVRKEGWKPVKNDKGFIEPEYSGSAASNKISTWGTYDEAVNSIGSGIFLGLGIMLHNQLCGIDIDGCIENGQFVGPAKGILDIMDTYAEYSPSGTGIHLLFYGEVKEDKSLYKKNPRNGVEIYSKGRYFTFTGNALNDKDVEERTEQIAQVQLEYMQKESKKETAENKPVANLSDSELIKIASRAKNGRAFQKLWEGDISEYSSQSEADLALCNILSFYAQADSSRIDSLFRQSGLYREKWEREDYRSDTINKAIAATKNTYSPKHNSSAAYFDFVNNMEDIETDEKFFLIPKDINYPEKGLKVNVSLLAMYMKRKHDIKYYKNQFRIFKDNYYSYVEDIKRIISSEIPEFYRMPKNIKDCEDLLIMDSELTLRDEDLSGPKYIAFKNGVLNVETMQFRGYKDKAAKQLIFINQINYDYSPNAPKCDYADNFFSTATNDKQEDIDYLYQILGVLISSYRDFKNIFYFSGKKDTGKSVFMRLMGLMLTNSDGIKDFSSIGLRTLTDETSMEFTGMIGKKANICAETPDLKITNDVLLKQLSGGDSITARVKFKDSIEFKNNAMLIFAGNTVPNFFTSDKSAISERMLIYEFKNVIPKGGQIKRLEEKINMQYIIKKAIEQLRVFIKNNKEFAVPQEIYDNQEKMVIDSDTIYKFYKEQIIVTDDSRDRISNVDLYGEYINFMVKEGHLRLNYYGMQPDLSKFKITQYKFTSGIKKYHGQDRYKRNMSYKNSKTDVFTNMILRKNSDTLVSLNKSKLKVIDGAFP